jgi:hypothetical protein
MFSSIEFERRVIQVPTAEIAAAASALRGLGVSVSCREGRLTALVRLGSKGSEDRLAIYHVELRFSKEPSELVQWVRMCWNLPALAGSFLQK